MELGFKVAVHFAGFFSQVQDEIDNYCVQEHDYMHVSLKYWVTVLLYAQTSVI